MNEAVLQFDNHNMITPQIMARDDNSQTYKENFMVGFFSISFKGFELKLVPTRVVSELLPVGRDLGQQKILSYLNHRYLI